MAIQVESSIERSSRSFSRTLSVPVHPQLGCKRVVVELSVPALSGISGPISFAEHVQRDGGATTDVIACARGGVVASTDLGETWKWIPIPELSDLRLQNVFTTACGMHILQGEGFPDGDPSSASGGAMTVLLDEEWRLLNQQRFAHSRWHGTRSVDEANGVIVFGEYPANQGIYDSHPEVGPPTQEQQARFHDSRLLRSTDGGRSWDVALHLDWRTIRHFHTVVADPWQPGRWWASTGDRPRDTGVWESTDHGASWDRMSVDLPVEELHPTQAQYAASALRHTDVVVRETELIWGADDLLGGAHLHDAAVSVDRRAGARLFASPKEQPWAPRTIGHVGNPIRSLIDVDLAYVITTEAKGPFGFCPQVFLLWKTKPFQLMPLMTLDNFRESSPATGFSYSRSSRAAKDGVFFTYRAGTDVFPSGPGVLRWRIAFD